MRASVQLERLSAGNGRRGPLSETTHFNLSVPISLRCTSSIRSGAGRHRTTVPLRSCPDDSWSLPRKTMKSLLRLGTQLAMRPRPGSQDRGTLPPRGGTHGRGEEDIPNVEQSIGVTSSDVRQRVEMRHSPVSLLYCDWDSRCVAQSDSGGKKESRGNSRPREERGQLTFIQSGQACQAMGVGVDPDEAENVTERSNTGLRRNESVSLSSK